MSGLEEETYSTMFTSLRHPARRRILRMLAEKPRNFSKMLEELGISSSHLTYHLESLGELVSKMEDGRYKLSTFGEAAVTTMSRVEEAPKTTEPRHPPSLPMKWRSFFAVLMIGLIVLAGVCYTQYQSLNQASAEYQQLKAEYERISEEYSQLKESLNRVSAEYERVSAEYEKLRAEFEKVSADYERLKGLVALTHFEDVSLQSKYTLRFFLRWEANDTLIDIQGPWDCVIYSPYDNSTLHLFLSIITLIEDSYVAVSIQEGNAYDPTTNETATVIWSLNATKSSILYVPLPTKGWYTISLVGPIRKHLDESGKVIGYTAGPMPGAFGDADCSLSLRIIYEGNYISFIVTHGYRYITWIDYISPS